MKIRETIRKIRAGATSKIVLLKGKAVYWGNYALLREKTRSYVDLILREENERYMAASAYVPFIGWLFPLYLKRESGFCQDHGKTGLMLALFFTALVLVFFFLNLLIVPRDWRELRLGLVVLIYLCYTAYFCLCGYGVYCAVNRKKLENRWINQYKNVIPL